MDWIERAKKGDKKAIEELYIKCLPSIKSICSNYYVRGQDNEDLQQMATIVFLNAIDKFKYKKLNNKCVIGEKEREKERELEWISFLAYLKRSIKNKIIDQIRNEEKLKFRNYRKSSISENEIINMKENSKTRQQVELHNCINNSILLEFNVSFSAEEQYMKREREKEIIDILKGLSLEEKKLINYIYNKDISLMEYSKIESIKYNDAYYFRKKLQKKLKILLSNI